MRELLQGSDFCKVQLQRYCAEGGSGCGPQLRSMCESVARQHAQCETQALQYCRQQRHGDCKATVARHCPAAEKKSVDQILARYDLDAGQEARLRQLATQLERDDRTAIGRLVTQLSQLLGLR